MKILVLTNLYPPHYLGGYELICYMVVNELRARGHQVQILTSNHRVEGRTTSEPELMIERKLEIHGFYGHPWRNIYKLGKLESYNNKVLTSTIEAFKPDLVYVWNMGGLGKSLVLTLQKLGLPTVFYLSDHWIARGFSSDVWLQWWNRKEVKISHRAVRALAKIVGIRRKLQSQAPTNPESDVRFQRLYFCSKALRKLTASAGFEVMHGAVIYAPVDIQRFFGNPKPESAALKRFLWVGRLSPDKGILTALKAMQLVQPKFDGELHVYGGGDPKYVQELKAFVNAHKLRVEFQSANMDAMPAIYREYDALLFTSEWAEPFALTPLEAMASGLPVIATLTGGSRELFRHGFNAFTYNAGNSEELAARMLELAIDHRTRARIAATGQTEVRANYSLPVIVDQIENYLAESARTWSNPGLPDYRR